MTFIDQGDPVRVAIVTESFLPSANGVTTSVLRVLDHLEARGHQAVVVCPGPAPSAYRGFEVRVCPAVNYRGFRTGIPSPQLSRTLTSFEPHVLHAASPFGLGAMGLTVARRLDIPTVAIFQTDIAGFARRHGLSLTAGAAWRWMRKVHSNADITLAPSSATLADLADNGIERTRLWARGVDAVTFHPRRRVGPAAQALRASLTGNDPNKVLVGYVGRLAPEKEVELLSAVAKIPGARLVVVGDGPSRPALERRLLDTDAVLLGRLDGEALANAYSVLDVFVHTGSHETFGQTLQEAMASGVPVVAPAAGGPLDVVQHGETGWLFNPGDAKDLEMFVRGLVVDPALRARMGEAGRRLILPRSWEALGGQLLDHYAEAIAMRALRLPTQVDLRRKVPVARQR